MIIKHILNSCVVLLVFSFTGVLLFLPSILALMGLTSIGPVSGGLFASMQGAGIASGSLMAVLQSFAMSGWVVVVQMVSAILCAIIYTFTFIKHLLRGRLIK